MKPTLSALLAFGTALALGAPLAAAQPKVVKPKPAPKACGVTAIPLSVGNEWVYEPDAPPADRVLSEAQIRTTPVQPKKLTIKVTNIETKPDGTIVTLSEDLDGKAHTTTIRCTSGGATFSISPEAFWFAGEPGIVHGLELTDVERKGQTLSLAAGKLTGLEWHDDLKAKWKHVPVGKAQPKSRSGTLAITRHWVLLSKEGGEILEGKDGKQLKTIKLGLETTVSVVIEPAPPLPLKAPPLSVNFLWIVDGTGPVQVLNNYAQQYALTSFVIN